MTHPVLHVFTSGGAPSGLPQQESHARIEPSGWAWACSRIPSWKRTVTCSFWPWAANCTESTRLPTTSLMLPQSKAHLLSGCSGKRSSPLLAAPATHAVRLEQVLAEPHGEGPAAAERRRAPAPMTLELRDGEAPPRLAVGGRDVAGLDEVDLDRHAHPVAPLGLAFLERLRHQDTAFSLL